MLDPTHFKFRDLENRVLLYTFHINRIKLTSLSTPRGTVSNQMQLFKAIQDTTSIKNMPNTEVIQKCIVNTSIQIPPSTVSRKLAVSLDKILKTT